jgi:hypothetical protein
MSHSFLSSLGLRVGACFVLAGVLLGHSSLRAENYEVSPYVNTLSMPATPAGYSSMIRNGIVSGSLNCGFESISGRDPRLPNSVLSRDVQEVLARVKENGKLEVHVLIDNVVNPLNFGDTTATQFLKRNGGRIMEIEIDPAFEDISVQADVGGRVAYSVSSRTNHQVETTWRVRGPSGMKRVEESEFSKYLAEKVIATYVTKICKNKYKL